MSKSNLHILLSAPYMIPVWPEFAGLFEERNIEVTIPEVNERLSAQELLPYAGQIDGTICGDDHYTERVLRAASPRLKVISKWGTGIDSIDLEAAEKLGVEVCNTPGAFTDPVADSVLGYILAFARRTVWLDREMKQGHWSKLPGRALHECSLGVVGVGRIGKEVLRRAKAFGMKLYGNDIVQVPAKFIEEVGPKIVSLERLLERSDFVSLNCDLNPRSKHLIDEQALRLMRPSSVLVNTSRGAVIDEPALIRALGSGSIAGAGLDVFEDEPLPLESPLRQMDNVLLAPHNANSSPEAWRHVHENSIRNLFRALAIELPEQLSRG